MRRAMIGAVVLLSAAWATGARASEEVVLTAGLVRAVDHTNGVVLLDSGLRLRVRNAIVDDKLASVTAIRVDQLVFVSGVVVERTVEAGARARAGQ